MAFFRHADDYAQAIEQVIRAGGDTDTVAAITGALVSIRVGVAGIPEHWRDRHRDWPWGLQRLLALRRPPLAAWPVVLLRNVSFFVVILAHIVRRALPPW